MIKRILIIDDEQDIREVVKASLEDLAGWKTITTGSGTEGLQLAKTYSWDAILLDISMPGMDGFDFYSQLQADTATQSIPVLLLTAKVLPSDRHRFTEMGVAGVITKPFNPITLFTQIAHILGWQVGTFGSG